MYLFAHVAFRWRNVGSINVQQSVVGVVVPVLIWSAASIPALGLLALVTVAIVALITFEAIRFADICEQVRHDEEIALSRFGRPMSEDT